MSRRQCGYPWPSLAISPYHSSPPAGLQGYILCPHIVAVCRFVLVVPLLHIHMWGPQEYIAYELVLASPAVSCVSGSFVGNFIFKWVTTYLFAPRYCYFFYTVKWFKVLLTNTNNFIQHYSFVCTQLNGSKYCYASLTIQLNISICLLTVEWSNSCIPNNSVWC